MPDNQEVSFFDDDGEQKRTKPGGPRSRQECVAMIAGLCSTVRHAALNGAAVRTAAFDWNSDADLARAAASGPCETPCEKETGGGRVAEHGTRRCVCGRRGWRRRPVAVSSAAHATSLRHETHDTWSHLSVSKDECTW